MKLFSLSAVNDDIIAAANITWAHRLRLMNAEAAQEANLQSREAGDGPPDQLRTEGAGVGPRTTAPSPIPCNLPEGPGAPAPVSRKLEVIEGRAISKATDDS